MIVLDVEVAHDVLVGLGSVDGAVIFEGDIAIELIKFGLLGFDEELFVEALVLLIGTIADYGPERLHDRSHDGIMEIQGFGRRDFIADAFAEEGRRLDSVV